MADYHLVTLAKGPAWDHSRSVRTQAGWDARTPFMDALVDEGIVVLDGPVDSADGDAAVLVVDVDDEPTIRARLAADPWSDTVLTVKRVEPWSIWLRAPGGAAPA